MTPRILGGRYEMTRLLRAGPVTDVYEGFDQQRRQHVIIEVLPAGLSSDVTSVDLFTKAFDAASRLDHPGIVPVGRATKIREIHFAVRDVMGGPSLREFLQEHGPPRPSRAAVIAAALGEALSHAHGKGVVHGGISPSDILLTQDGDVKLSGFGLAASTVYDIDARYAAPERSEHNVSDARSDLYALGCCLYEMLAGWPPFGGDTPLAIAEQHLHRKPKLPDGTGAGPNIPAELVPVVRRLLAKKPDDRYQDARKVVQDLHRYLVEDAKNATPSGALANVSIFPSVPRPGSPATGEPGTETAAGSSSADGVTEPAGTGVTDIQVTIVDAPALPVPRPGGQLLPVAADTEVPAAGLSSRRTIAMLAAAVCIPFAVGGLLALRWSGGSDADDRPPDGERAAAVSDIVTRTTEWTTTTSSSTTSTTKPPVETTTTTTTTTTQPETTTTSPVVTGPPPAPSTTTTEGTRVPNVQGSYRGDAERTLREAGFEVEVRTTWTWRRSQDGRVESQRPGGGSSHPAGSTVTIVVWQRDRR